MFGPISQSACSPSPLSWPNLKRPRGPALLMRVSGCHLPLHSGAAGTASLPCSHSRPSLAGGAGWSRSSSTEPGASSPPSISRLPQPSLALGFFLGGAYMRNPVPLSSFIGVVDLGRQRRCEDPGCRHGRTWEHHRSSSGVWSGRLSRVRRWRLRPRCARILC